jgi:hypothetical protein
VGVPQVVQADGWHVGGLAQPFEGLGEHVRVDGLTVGSDEHRAGRPAAGGEFVGLLATPGAEDTDGAVVEVDAAPRGGGLGGCGVGPVVCRSPSAAPRVWRRRGRCRPSATRGSPRGACLWWPPATWRRRAGVRWRPRGKRATGSRSSRSARRRRPGKALPECGPRWRPPVLAVRRQPERCAAAGGRSARSWGPVVRRRGARG